MSILGRDDDKIYPSGTLKADVKNSPRILCDTYDIPVWFYSENKDDEVNKYITRLHYEQNEITFKKVDYDHSGYYFCHGSYSNGSLFIAGKRLKIYGNIKILIV